MGKTLPQILARIFITASAMVIGAKIHYSLGAIPGTLQTFFLCLTALYFTPQVVFSGQVLYLVFGIFFPVFSHHYYGNDVLTGISAGYLYLFPVAAFLISRFVQRTDWFSLLSWCVVAHFVILLGGAAWMLFFKDFSSDEVLMTSLDLLPGAFVKSAAVVLIFLIGEKFLKPRLTRKA